MFMYNVSSRLRPTAYWVDTTRRDNRVSPSPLPHVSKNRTSSMNQRDATHTYMIKIIHMQLLI